MQNRGDIRNLWSMTKKRSSEILTDENGKIFREKVKFLKSPRKFKKFSKTGGKSETGGKCIMASGGWTPLAISHDNKWHAYSYQTSNRRLPALTLHYRT